MLFPPSVFRKYLIMTVFYAIMEGFPILYTNTAILFIFYFFDNCGCFGQLMHTSTNPIGPEVNSWVNLP